MRILITGVSGLLGINLALEASKMHTTIGVTHTHRVKSKAFETLQSDLLAPGAVENLLENLKPDWVIHCAGLTNLDACEANPALAERLNTWLPETLAHHVARGGARLVHISTDAVFDGRNGNYMETDTPHPLSIYAKTKLAAEQRVAEAFPEAIIARINIYGWSLSGKRSIAEFFFYNLLAGKPIPGFIDVSFCPLLVNDLAAILLKMIEQNLNGLFHIVSSESVSKYEFGLALAEKFSFDKSLIIPTKIENSDLKATRSPNLTLNTNKLTRILGIKPPGTASGLDKFNQLYLHGYPQMIQKMAT